MNTTKEVLIRWHDEPETEYLSTICIGESWTEEEDDQNIFFYFSTEKEFESAKNKDNNLEFWITEER
jgi:hypothetical protein